MGTEHVSAVNVEKIALCFPRIRTHCFLSPGVSVPSNFPGCPWNWVLTWFLVPLPETEFCTVKLSGRHSSMRVNGNLSVSITFQEPLRLFQYVINVTCCCSQNISVWPLMSFIAGPWAVLSPGLALIPCECTGACNSSPGSHHRSSAPRSGQENWSSRHLCHFSLSEYVWNCISQRLHSVLVWWDCLMWCVPLFKILTLDQRVKSTVVWKQFFRPVCFLCRCSSQDSAKTFSNCKRIKKETW